MVQESSLEYDDDGFATVAGETSDGRILTADVEDLLASLPVLAIDAGDYLIQFGGDPGGDLVFVTDLFSELEYKQVRVDKVGLFEQEFVILVGHYRMARPCGGTLAWSLPALYDALRLGLDGSRSHCLNQKVGAWERWLAQFLYGCFDLQRAQPYQTHGVSTCDPKRVLPWMSASTTSMLALLLRMFAERGWFAG